MAGKHPDIASVLEAQLQSRTVPSAERDIETVTSEIIQLKQDAGNAILGIGQRLIEAKEMLPHGEWLPWLTERVEFSERTAQNFIRLAREWSNPQALADLGATKALTLLALPPEEREIFMAENHIVDGEEKNVIDMTSRELEKAIRERDEARKAMESAQADARAAEECRAKMEADMALLKSLQTSAQKAEVQARDELEKAQAELQVLRDRPVEVAVETVADEAAVKKARKDAIAEMQAKVDKAEAAQKEAEKKRRSAETALAEATKQAGANAAILRRAEDAERALAEARRQLEAAAKAEVQTAISSDADLASFKLLFDQAQAQVNQLRGILLNVRGKDETAAGKLQKALLALADMVRGCAE